jgi:ubiquinone/menaquinone biosynthesis C-methylase UbiE
MSQGHWQVEGNAAELYQRYLVPAITTKWAMDLVHRAQPKPGETVLDVACGTGVVARTAASMMAQGRVIGLDLNSGMLDVARTVPSEGAPITWVEASAVSLPFPADSFDLVLCQLGLQFFPDKERALAEMRRVLLHSGRIALSVYSGVERTPGAYAFVQALDRVFGPHSSKIKRGEHSFYDPEQLRNLLEEAGFAAVEVQTVTQQIAFPSLLDYVRFQLTATPMAGLLEDYGEIDREAAIAKVAAETAHFSTAAMLQDGMFSFPQEAYVATARKHL